MFWFDGPLDWIALLSIRSFVRFPSVTIKLFSYDKSSDPNLPRCEWKNADDILRYDVANHYRSRFSVTFAANIFKYQLLYQKGGWHFDTDCLLIRPLDSLFDSEYVFGQEDAKWVAVGVVKFPANHELMMDMYSMSTRFNPSEYSLGRITAPKIFTKYLRDYGLIQKALPPEYFYPIHWSNLEAFRHSFTPSQKTFMVHLWSKILRQQSWKASDLDSSFSNLGWS
jgi:mannosyltransferase OCH1-like enzyme